MPAVPATPGLPQWQWYPCSFWGNGRSALYHHEVSKPQQQAPPVAASGLLQPPIFTDVLTKNGGFAGPRIITLKEQRSLAGRPWDLSARTRHRSAFLRLVRGSSALATE
jgi:hypothetical protein